MSTIRQDVDDSQIQAFTHSTLWVGAFLTTCRKPACSAPCPACRIYDLFANDISAEEILDFAGSLSALQVSRRQAYYATLVRLGVPRECDLRAWDVLTVERA